MQADSHYARRYYVQQKDTCSTGIPRICTYIKQILIGWKLIFGNMVQWQLIHRTAEGQQTTAFHCTMYLLPLDHASKNQLSTNQNLLKAHANSWNNRWICIVLHSVTLANSEGPDQTALWVQFDLDQYCLPRNLRSLQYHQQNVKFNRFTANTIWQNNTIWATTWQNQQSECAPSEDSDQPGHLPSLIRGFAIRIKKPWVLSYPLSAQRRLWSDRADAKADLSLCWANTQFVCFVMMRLI